jgi:hypothetical protein
MLLDRVMKLGITDSPEKPLLTGKDFIDIAQGDQIGLLVKKAYQLQIDENITEKNFLKQAVLQKNIVGCLLAIQEK